MQSTKVPTSTDRMTMEAAARIESKAARDSGGQVKSGTFTSRAKRAAAKHANGAGKK